MKCYESPWLWLLWILLLWNIGVKCQDASSEDMTEDLQTTEDGLQILTQGANNTLGQSCVKRYTGSRQHDGYIFTNRSEEQCRDLCFGSQDCASVTYHWETRGCYLHTQTNNRAHQKHKCCVHYKRVVCPLDEDGNPQNTTIYNTTTLDNETTTDNGTNPAAYHNDSASTCLVHFSSSLQSIEGDTYINQTVESCASLCSTLFRCASVDYNFDTGDCVVHDRTSAKSHHRDNCCTHVKKLPCISDEGVMVGNTEPECTNKTILKMYINANQLAGTRIESIRNRERCKDYCRNSPDCAALDFHRYENSCWVHQTTNITSHEYSGCCDHYKKKVVCQYDCFTAERNVRPLTLGGVLYSDDSLSQCRARCLSSDNCLSFVFSPTQHLCMLVSERVPPGLRLYDVGFEYWVKTTCEGHYNDTIIDLQTTTTITTTPQPTTTAPNTPPSNKPSSVIRATSRDSPAGNPLSGGNPMGESQISFLKEVFKEYSNLLNLYAIIIHDFTRKPDVKDAKTKKGGFLKTTSAIIVFTACGFIFLVGCSTFLLFCIHRIREKKRLKKPTLANSNLWLRNHNGTRTSTKSSSLWTPITQTDVYNHQKIEPIEAWHQDLHNRKGVHGYPPYVGQVKVHNNNNRRNSYHADVPLPCRGYHGNIDKSCCDPYKKLPRMVPDYSTYPSRGSKRSYHSPMYVCTEISSHPEHSSPMHLQRIDSNSILSDEALYREEFGKGDHFYTGSTAF